MSDNIRQWQLKGKYINKIPKNLHYIIINNYIKKTDDEIYGCLSVAKINIYIQS